MSDLTPEQEEQYQRALEAGKRVVWYNDATAEELVTALYKHFPRSKRVAWYQSVLDGEWYMRLDIPENLAHAIEAFLDE